MGTLCNKRRHSLRSVDLIVIQQLLQGSIPMINMGILDHLFQLFSG